MSHKVYRGVYAAKTDKGRVRRTNEDQAGVIVNADDEVFLVVCDGVGGASRGELASKIAMDSLLQSFREKRKHRFAFLNRFFFHKALKEANALIYDTARKNESNCGNMSTTVVCALITGSHLMVASLGDSRAYLYKNGVLEQLTEDETYVHTLVKAGKISPQEAAVHPDRHVIMNALGIYPSVSFSFLSRKYEGEPLLLCTDGLYTQVAKEDISAIISTNQRADQKVLSLIMEANSAGGSDNCGIAYWEAFPHD